MRKVIAGVFLSVDGVMQAPGGPQEDTSGGFAFGGWLAPYWDETSGAAVDALFKSFDLLLGRKTYDIFASYWPKVADGSSESGSPEDKSIALAFDKCRKYVATHDASSLKWKGSQALGADIIAGLTKVKAGAGPNLVIQGSSELVHQLMAAGLIDELQLMIFPVVLGKGKRFFDGTSMPRAFNLTGSETTSKGVIIAKYARAGEVEVGSMG